MRNLREFAYVTYAAVRTYLRGSAYPVPFFIFSLLLLLISIIGKEPINEVLELIRHRPETDEDEDDETFLRRFSICEEDRLARTGEMRTGRNGPRWFRSENVIPIEWARKRSPRGGL